MSFAALKPTVVAVLMLFALTTVPPPPAHPQPAGPLTDTYTSFDVGFAEGAGLYDDELARRLGGMADYVPGRSPLIRVDLDWWYVEPCSGCPLAWDRLDPVVDQATARGMRVLIVLAYAPSWANGGHTDDKWFPTRDADWTRIIDRTVEHFGTKVQAYEVWNEPNIEGFGNYAGDRRARYWQLVRLAHQRIHAACPACVVLAGASGNGSPASQTRNDNESALWLDWAYANGYGNYFDAVAHHPYPAWSAGKGPSDPECANRWWNMFGPRDESRPCGELAYVHSVMVKHGDTAKKIWATEWGYPTSGATNIALETVRDYLAESVSMWRSLPYTGPLFLYSYRDACRDAANPECNFGVVTRDFVPKGVLYSDLSAALADAWGPTLPVGRSLRRWASLLSEDRRFQVWLQDDGNLVLYRRYGAPLWASGTRNGVRLTNQSDGNLVLYRADGGIAWSSGTYGNGPSTLWMQDDGNLVLYRNSDGKPTWASGTVAG